LERTLRIPAQDQLVSDFRRLHMPMLTIISPSDSRGAIERFSKRVKTIRLVQPRRCTRAKAAFARATESQECSEYREDRGAGRTNQAVICPLANPLQLKLTIYRLRAEKEALGNLLGTPAVPSSRQVQSSLLSNDQNLDQTLLSETDIAALDSLPRSATSSDRISQSINGLYDSLGPTIDKFADGIHTIGQYCQAADNVASRALAICAERLSQREKEGRKRALPEAQGTPPKDLGGVLRSLSRADR